MRFACDSCQTKYSIADEKVRGKVLKIRCKKCSAVILVKQPEPEPEPEQEFDSESTRAMSVDEVRKLAGGDKLGLGGAAPAGRPPARARLPDDDVEWFAMIEGTQEGPWSSGAFSDHVHGGKITARTFVWHEALGDWKRAGEVEALTILFAPASAAVPPPKAAPKPPPKADPPPRREEPEAPPEPAAAATEEPRPEPAAAEPEEPAHRPEPRRPVADLFDEEPAEAPAPKGGAPLAAAGPSVDPFGDVPDAPGLEAPAPGEQTRFFMAQAGVDRKGKTKRIAIISTTIIAALMGVFALFLFAPSFVLPEVPVNEKGEPVADPGIWTAQGMEGLRNKLLGLDQKPKAPPKAAGPRTAAGPAPTPKDDPLIKRDEPKPAGGPSEDEKLAIALLGDGLQPKETKIEVSVKTEAPKLDNAPLDEAAVGKTIADNAGAYKRCIDDAIRRNPNFKGGRVEISATIGPSGIVTTASLSDPAMESSDMGTCIKDRTRRMIFPKFEGEPFEVKFPLVLGSGG